MSSSPQTYPVAAEGAEFNPTNIFKFIAAVSPIILTWFLAAASIFNQDIKGIIYLAGLLIAICINVLLSNMIKSKPFPERNAVCEIFNLPFASTYNSPSVNSMIIAFTAAYLIAPMKENDQMNYGIVAFLAIILVVDGITKVTNYCTPIAGVILALTIPHDTKNNKESLLLKLEHGLSPYVAFGIMPLFAFANAGVSLEGLTFATLLNPVPLGIVLGLFFGKQIGVFVLSYISVKLKFADKPSNSTWPAFYAVSILTGIGFTMSLFVGNLAFANDLQYMDGVKIGVLAGSLLSTLFGYFLLLFFSKK